MILFVERVLDIPLTDYVTTLIDRLRQGTDTEMYLRAVVGTYQQLCRFVRYLNKPKDATTAFRLKLFHHVNELFAEQVEPYLRVELDYYKKRCDSVVVSWKKKVPASNSVSSNVADHGRSKRFRVGTASDDSPRKR